MFYTEGSAGENLGRQFMTPAKDVPGPSFVRSALIDEC